MLHMAHGLERLEDFNTSFDEISHLKCQNERPKSLKTLRKELHQF
jgi:hypothetical protein